MRVNDQEVTFNLVKSMKYPAVERDNECFRMEISEHLLKEHFKEHFEESDEVILDELENEELDHVQERFEKLDITENADKNLFPSIIKPHVLELKLLSSHFKSVFLGNSSTLPVIISSELNDLQEQRLLDTLKRYKKAFGWTLADIKGISPSICMHRIILDEQYKPKLIHKGD